MYIATLPMRAGVLNIAGRGRRAVWIVAGLAGRPSVVLREQIPARIRALASEVTVNSDST